MCCDEEYPVVIRSDGLRSRPARVLLMTNGRWRVDWIGGLISLYRGDPRAHLKLGYDPQHLRFWRPSPNHDADSAFGPVAGHGG